MVFATQVDHEFSQTFSCQVQKDDQGSRLDAFLSRSAVGLSRSRIQSLIRAGQVTVDDRPSKPSHLLRAGEEILVAIPSPSLPEIRPETVEFGVVHEDAWLIVVNKPAGVVVHPSPGHSSGTLVHGLLKHCKHLSGVGGVARPGIVHRLDKDTSGLMVVAKNDKTHTFLSEQFKSGLVEKHYLTLVHGRVKENEGRIDLPISRHPARRKEMSVAPSGGRRALTLWRKLAEFESGFTLLFVSLKTGRTHQIRVHLSHMGHPVLGDAVYGRGRDWGKRHRMPRGTELPPIKRQMLHAKHLGFAHPGSGGLWREFEAPLPDDMKEILRFLEQNHSRG